MMFINVQLMEINVLKKSTKRKIFLSDSSYIYNVCRFSFKQPKVWNNKFGHCPFLS